jgi:hypothetical protein
MIHGGKYEEMEVITCITSLNIVFLYIIVFEDSWFVLYSATDYLIIWLPLRCSGQISWLQTQRSWFESQPYQIFWVSVGLE